MTALSFQEFLEAQGQGEEPTKDQNQKTSVCLGNPAGDADSIVSSLGLAYAHHVLRHPKQMTPLVSIPRADLALRRETILLLRLAGIKDTSILLHVDDEGRSPAATDVTLLDHNRLVDSHLLERPNVTVVEILDHHMDEQHHLNVKDDARLIAFDNGQASVASTCTLVAERLLSPSATDVPATVPTELAVALLGVILLDSVNQSPEAGKVTPRDTTAIGALLNKTDWSLLEDKSFLVENVPGSTPSLDVEKLYTYLSSSKFDPAFWTSLSVTDALRLDYKRFQGSGLKGAFGASSVLLPLTEFLQKPDLSKQVKDFMISQEVPLLLVMSMTMVAGVPSRSMAIFGTGDGERSSLVDKVTDYLLNNEAASTLQSTETKLLEIADGLTARTLHQGNPKASRKQVVPILLEFYKRHI